MRTPNANNGIVGRPWGAVAAATWLLACGSSGAPADRADVEVPSDGGPQQDATGQDTTQQDTALDGDDADVAPDVRGEIGLATRPTNPTCVAAERPQTGAAVALTRAFPRLSFRRPLGMRQAPGDTSSWYVVEKIGRVVRVANVPDPAAADVFLDLTDVVHAQPSEMGLLGFAFDPNYATNRLVYASYNRLEAGTSYSRVSRFAVPAGGSTVDRTSEEVLLDFAQPFDNHNGGEIAFGQDGYLYLSFGDGGAAGDVLAYGQNRDVLFGKILRIDVHSTSPGRAYGIPADNPFAEGGGAPEIFAWGLRNVWKFSFDAATGELWAGDVGQGAREEVNLIRNGGNYGWKVFEGTTCYRNAPECDTLAAIAPVVEYPHSEGRSITGGYVYRGQEIPALAGRYVFGDFVSGTIWAVQYDPVTGDPTRQPLLEATGLAISSFGQGADGELFVLHYGQGQDGAIYRIEAAAPAGPDTFPAQLSQTGCVQPDAPAQPVAGMIPYEVRVPFHSDGATKTRYFALPDDTSIEVQPNGDLDLPIGSVVLKHFYQADRLFETRLLMRHDDGGWAGYSYAWRADGSDADWVRGGAVETVAGAPWLYPSGAQCLACHTDVAGRTLGLELVQLDRAARYAGGDWSDQLATLQHLGMLPADLPTTRALPVLSDARAPATDRAHAWLHVNCAMCHTEGGPARSNVDFSWHTASMADLCDQAPQAGDLDLVGARIAVANDPARSLLHVRAARRDAAAMPPLGSYAVDAQGLQLLELFLTSGLCGQ